MTIKTKDKRQKIKDKSKTEKTEGKRETAVYA
jgi:hypothetical protein